MKQNNLSDRGKKYMRFTLNENKVNCGLYALSDAEFFAARKHSIPASYDYGFTPVMSISRREENILPKWYIGLRNTLGKSNNMYDDYKGAFSFCAKLLIEHVSTLEMNEYLCNIMNYRSNVEIKIYKSYLKDDLNGISTEACQDTFSGFSQTLFDEFYFYLFGYCSGISQVFLEKKCVKDFVMRVASNHILFGCHDGVLFEEEIEDPDDFEQAFQRYEMENA